MHNFQYTEKALELQKRFDTHALAAVELQVIVHDELNAIDRAFIERMDMFWLASADASGWPTVSYKGGPKGFVKMPDDRTIIFPCYDGNGMFFSMGNVASNSKIGLLFMDFETPFRLRVQADAKLTDDPAIIAQFPGAQFAVKAHVTAIIQNCPRYVHRMQRVNTSRYVPDAKGMQPIPGWKRIDAIQPVLPQRDQNKADSAGGLISMDKWMEMTLKGDPLA